jgi:pSer/pThr/pTyr-binding forkhead associated (FHA) protein
VSSDGYYVIDLSTNGVFVNGEKIEGTHTLGRGDVIRVGTEEFRFYADVAKPSAAPAAPAAADAGMAAAPSAAPTAPAAPPPEPAPAAAPRSAAPSSLEPTAPAKPAYRPSAGGARPSGERPLLATLEIINEGPNKGKKFEIRSPLTHVGRGAHNDVAIEDDSVSDSHAKIQKKQDAWIISDVGSTNGTYVSGKRIATETALMGAPDVRFGGVKMMFKPVADALDAGKGTRAIAGVSVDQARRMSAAAADNTAAAATSPEKKKGIPVGVWIAAIVVLAAVAYFVMSRS